MKNFYSTTKAAVATTTLSLMTLGMVGLNSGNAEAVTFGTTWDDPSKCADAGTVSVPATCSLQDLFDSITVDGPGIDAEDDTGFEWFTSTATGRSSGSFMFEVAGFAPHNEFGLYNKSGQKARLFDGINDPGDGTSVTFLANGNLDVITQGFAPKFDDSTPIHNVFEDFGNEFGFYLTNKKGETFYSQNSKNGGDQQAAIYQGDDATTLHLPGRVPGLFTDNEFIIAFEDLVLGNSDADYNDLVVMMESIEPADVPEPSALLGLGLLGASFWSVRRRSRS